MNISSASDAGRFEENPRSQSRRIGYVLTKYDDLAASTRQRFHIYKDVLERHSIDLRFMPLLPNEYLTARFSGRSYPRRLIMQRYIARASALARYPRPDFLWIQYDAFPLVPFALEKLAYPKNVPRIYDFDDAVFRGNELGGYNISSKLAGMKFGRLLEGASLSICGNSFLKKYVCQYCRQTEIVPTIIDTDIFVPRDRRPSGPIVLGWIGSPSTWEYVRPLFPLLEKLQTKCDLRVRAVGSWHGVGPKPNFEFVEWSQAEEVSLIQSMDIGIMPLPDEAWARGKCGFKLIQYLSCGVPAIASPVGANLDIVDHLVNGFLPQKLEDWEKSIRGLSLSEDLRRRLGAAGRAKMEQRYSLKAYGYRLAGLLRGVSDSAIA